MYAVDGDANLIIGQVIIFATVVFKSLVDLYKERRVRLDKEQERKEALAREQRIKDEVKAQREIMGKLVDDRIAGLRKRLNGLLEEEK